MKASLLKKMKCEQYWPAKVGDALTISYDKKIIHQDRTILENDEQGQLIYSTFFLITKSEERVIHHYWLKVEKMEKVFQTLL